MQPRSYRDKAIVLRSYKLGEADRIVVLLGARSGQVRAVAKGVRRTTSKFGARLDALNLVDVQLHRGRNLDTVTQAELLAAYAAPLGADYSAFTAAKVMVETVQRLTDDLAADVVGESGSDYFPLLHGALGALAAGRHAPTLIAASFLLRVMRAAGWEPILSACAGCGVPLASAPGLAPPGQSDVPDGASGTPQFSAAAGGLVCSDCAPPGTLHIAPGTDRLLVALLAGDWETADRAPAEARGDAWRVASSWAQWNLEQRLRSVPFHAGL